MSAMARLGAAFFLGLLAVLAALYLRGLDHDPPYGILSMSGVFLTDEGWYTKSAQSLARRGEWGHPMDRDVYSHTPLFTLAMAAAFTTFGVRLEVARAVSVVSFFWSAFLIFLICRRQQGVAVAWVAAFLILTDFYAVTFARLAIVEPLGVAVSLSALYLAIAHPRSLGVSVLSLLLAAAAVFVKPGFLFTLGTVGVIWAVDAAGLWRLGERRAARRFAFALVGVAVLVAVAAQGVRTWAGEDWWDYQSVLEEMPGEMSPKNVLVNEWGAFGTYVKHDRRFVVVVAAFLVLPALFWRRTAAAAKRVLTGRAFAVMSLWAVSGFLFFSLFFYQSQRYYYFLLFATVFLALESLAAFFGTKRRLQAAVVLVVLHLGAQAPHFHEWLTREPRASYADMAKDVARRTARGDGEVVLLGLNAAYVSFFDERIRPLETHYVDPETLCRRVDVWRPPYLIHFASQAPPLEETCREVVAALEPVASYRVMDGYYFDSDVVLMRIVYPGAQ